jgi:hypothetical protein
VITDSACRRRLEALGIDASEVDDVDRLLRQLASRDVGVGGDEVSARLGQAFDHELARLTPELEAIAPALSRSISRTRAHVERGVARLAARVERARARRDKERVQRVEWLAQRLRPSGAPQERVLGFAHFAARFGIEPFKAAMFAAVDAHLDALARDEPDRLHEVAL